MVNREQVSSSFPWQDLLVSGHKMFSNPNVRLATPQPIKHTWCWNQIITYSNFVDSTSFKNKQKYWRDCNCVYVSAHHPHHPPCPPLCCCVHLPWPRYHWSPGWPGFLEGRLCPQLYKERNNMILAYIFGQRPFSKGIKAGRSLCIANYLTSAGQKSGVKY